MMEAEGQWKDLRVVDDGESLQLLLYDRVDEHYFMGEAMLKALKSYNDPAALVLSAISGFFPPHLRKERSSCVLLLELLMNVKPEVCKNVLRVKAEEMACLWRQKMQENGERRVVVLGFLLLLVGFQLKEEFERDELKRLWEIIDQHRLAPQLRFELDLFEECEGLGIARQRQAIVDGLRDSVLNFSENVSGTTAKDVMDMVLVTQYFDTMREISASSKSSAVFIPHGPGLGPLKTLLLKSRTTFFREIQWRDREGLSGFGLMLQ